MKKNNFIVNAVEKIAFAFMCVAMCTLTLSSCSDSDDDGGSDLDVPAYEAAAAKYVITDNNSPVESVEFTESGNYIITNNGYSAAYARTKSILTSKSMLVAKLGKNLVKARKNAARESTPYSPILYGKYTKTGENTYELEGWGTIIVKTDATGNAYSLEFKPKGGTSYTYTATKENRNLNSSNSNKLCRTWGFEKIRFYVKYNGKTMLDFSAKDFVTLANDLRKWAEKNDEEYDPNEWDLLLEEYKEIEPRQVVFTKTGTYMVYYKNNQLAVSTWRWYNNAENVLQYSWSNDFNDEDVCGLMDVKFNGSQLVMTEKEVYSDDGETEEEGMEYYMKEVK